MLILKPGVKIAGIKPELMVGLQVAVGVYAGLGVDCVVTSVTDGKHKAGSKHYCGMAADLRTRNFGTNEQMDRAVAQLRTRLNGYPDNYHGDWDIILEKDHIHMEYDPS